MNNTAEQFIATSKANAQALEGLASQAHASIEKLVELNLTASKALLGESFSHVQSVLGAKDAQEFLALQSSALKPLAEKSVAYFQHVQTILADSGAEFSKAVEAKTVEAQKAFNGVVENLAKNAPAGTESVVAAFKTALTAGQSAVESAQTSAKKAVEVAQSQFKAATTQAVDAVKKATKTA
ncbi:MAG: phasin family protein [Rhodoferax sp.]|nr:phasin family protein [Rhodoferax sp.]